MYTLVVKQYNENRHRLYYNPKTSEFYGHGGFIVDTLYEFSDDPHIQDFLHSIKSVRNIGELHVMKPECNHCPVVQLCKGQIPINISCDKEYAFSIQKLDHIIRLLTGMQLEFIEGYIERT